MSTEGLPFHQAIGWIEAGAQLNKNRVVCSNNKYFAYCSISSVIIRDVTTFDYVNLICYRKGMPVTISFPQNNFSLIAISYKRKETIVVDFVTNTIITTFSSPKTIVSIGWIENDTKLLCFSSYYSRYYIYDSQTGELVQSRYGFFSNIRIMSLFPKYPNVVVGGNLHGTVTMWDEDNVVGKYEHEGKIVAVESDPNSESSVLVAWDNGFWGLFDIAQSLKMIYSCDYSKPISSASWIKSLPGHIITCDSKTGIIRLWNPSSDVPIESRTIHISSIDIVYSVSKDNILCGFSDGMVAIYSYNNCSFLFQTHPTHKSPIFKTFCLPNDDNVFVSCSSDSSLCFWNIHNRELIDRINFGESQDKISCLDVSKNSDYILCGDNNGNIHLISIQQKRLIRSMKLFESPIKIIGCNPFNNSQVSIITENGMWVIFDFLKDMIEWRASFSSNITCSAFSPHKDGFRIAGTLDNRLFILQDTNHSSVELPGLTISHICFSPHLQNIVSLTTNNGGLYFFDTETKQLVSNDAVHLYDASFLPSFHPVYPDLVAIGGRDKRIVLISMKTGAYFYRFSAHDSVVTSVTFSKAYPSLLISASEDSSIRFWSMERLFIKKMINSILGMDYSYFSPIPGIRDIFSLSSHIRNQPSDQNVNFVGSIIEKTRKRIDDTLMSSSSGSIIKRMIRSREKMIMCAKQELQMGNKRKYCELMFSAGEYIKALSSAPSVSVEFWTELMNSYVNLENSKESKIPFSIALKKAESLDYVEGHEKKTLLAQNLEKQLVCFKSQNNVILPKIQDLSYNEYMIASCQAKVYFASGDILLGAMAYMSINDIDQTIMQLKRRGLSILAFSLNQIMGINNIYVKRHFIMLGLDSGLPIDTFFDILSNDDIIYFAPLVPIESSKIFSYEGEPLKSYLSLEMNTTQDKIHQKLVKKDFRTAAQDIIQFACEFIQHPTFDYSSIIPIINEIDLILLESIEKSVFYELFAISLYFGAYLAFWKRYFIILPSIKDILHSISKQNISWMPPIITQVDFICSISPIEKSAKLETIGYKYLNHDTLGVPYDERIKYGPKYSLYKSGFVSMEFALMWNEITPFSNSKKGSKHPLI